MKILKEIGRSLLTAFLCALFVCTLGGSASFSETNSAAAENEIPMIFYITAGMDVSQKDTKDFFDTMGEAVGKAEVIEIDYDKYVDCSIANEGTDLITVDWFWWSESEMEYYEYLPVELKKDYSTTIYMDGRSKNSVYLIHLEYKNMDKYIAFRPKSVK